MTDYDVVICGGGLAGVTLARQLRLRLPELSLLVLDRSRRPLPVATHKVGESTVEGATHWLRQTLKLREYVDQNHLLKFGLRFFGTSGGGRFEDRFELGARSVGTFTPLPSYQFDRGVLENDLRRMNDDLGIETLEGVIVKDIVLNDAGPHHVRYQRPGSTTTHSVSCRWVVDATGRCRFLARKLRLTRDTVHHASASWWRVAGKKDVSELVSETNRHWHQRVNDLRWYSTNHILGEGYWVWLIPLCSDNTSVGIVADERLHPIRERQSYELSYRWLRNYEPHIAQLLASSPPLDFLAVKRYSHSSERVFSDQRWCCVGEAGAFTDPLYSTGSDLIAWANTVTTHLIELDLQGRLHEDVVNVHNQVFLECVEIIIDLVRDVYPVFGNDFVTLHKLGWDAGMYFAVPAQMLIQEFVTCDEILSDYLALIRRYRILNRRVQTLFRDWAGRRDAKKLPAGAYSPFPGFQNIADMIHGIAKRKTPEELLREMGSTLERFEEYAQVFFLHAVRDVVPEAEESLPVPFWVRTEAVGLDRQRWAADGLFAPSAPPRDLRTLQAAFADFGSPVAPSPPPERRDPPYQPYFGDER